MDQPAVNITPIARSINVPARLTNGAFLEGVFGAAAGRALVCGFRSDPTDTLTSPTRWHARPWSDVRSPDVLATMNAFFCIGVFEGNLRRVRALEACYLIVVDDVRGDVDFEDKAAWKAARAVPAMGLEMAWGAPSYRIETSPGNEQWGYLLERPDARGLGVKALVDALVKKLGFDPGMAGPNRLVRLPEGVNTKKKYGVGGYPHVVRGWDPGRRFALGTLALGLGLDPGQVVNVVGTEDEPGVERGINDDDDDHAGQVEGIGSGIGSGHGVPGRGDPVVDPVVDAMVRWGWCENRTTNDGGVHIRCPWESEHTGGGGGVEDGAAYWNWMRFKCMHTHCAHRSGRDFKVKFDEQLASESGGLFTSAGGLVFDAIPGYEPPLRPGSAGSEGEGSDDGGDAGSGGPGGPTWARWATSWTAGPSCAAKGASSRSPRAR